MMKPIRITDEESNQVNSKVSVEQPTDSAIRPIRNENVDPNLWTNKVLVERPIKSIITGEYIRPPIGQVVSAYNIKSHDTVTVTPNWDTAANEETYFDGDETTPFGDINDKNTAEIGTIAIPENQYIPIFHYYIQKGFSGKTLLLYALICSMVCQSDKQIFYCGKNRIASWIGGSMSNANALLNKLAKKGHIIKTGEKIRGVNVYKLPEKEHIYISGLFQDAVLKKTTYYRKKKQKRQTYLYRQKKSQFVALFID